MSKTLLESDFLTVDIQSIYNRAANTAEQNSAEQAAPANGLGSDIEAELKLHGVPEEIITKLATLGDLFKKSLRILGFKKDDPKSKHNPILAFIKQTHVQKLLIDGVLNANTFKGIYNAVAKNLVATSEFFNTNTYNIIYCKDLYTKSAKEIEEYLKLQSSILEVSANAYDAAKQEFNRKIFINITDITEPEPTKRAKLILSPNTKSVATTNDNAKLNSLKLAKAICGKQESAAVALNSEDQKNIVDKLQSKEALAAAILAISMTTDSENAKKAIASGIFTNTDSAKVLTAASKIATSNILPKGKLQATDANAIVDKILAKMQQLQQNKNS